MASQPQFIERDAQQILADMISAYEQVTGRVLQPAQVERLVINTFAYREYLVREKIQAAALQNLVAFASAPVLDYLGDLVGVKRLPASRAFCKMRFTLVTGHNNLVIPAGLRVSSSDGAAIFVTIQPTPVAANIDEVDIDVECQSEGVVGNGYLPGTVNVILDPQAYLAEVENIETTSGGGDQETDEQLRERIKMAPSSFSVAGPVGAYRFHAKSASPLITDVAVLSSVPGLVEIYPLIASGTTPQQILDAVFEKCDDDKIRPLTDTVEVIAPTIVNYDIEVDLVLLTTADQQSAVAEVNANLQAHAAELRASLGKDVVRSKITQLAQVSGVYSVTVVSPAADIVIAGNESPEIGSITVNVTGITNG